MIYMIIVVSNEKGLRHSALDAESHGIAGQARNDDRLFSIETTIQIKTEK